MYEPSSHYRPTRPSRLATVSLLAAALLLSSCSDGGSAGDNSGDGSSANGDSQQANNVEPFVGLWEISGNWNGTADTDGMKNDIAYLSFAAIGADGKSVVTLFDLDDGGENCHFTSVGVAEDDIFGAGIFLQGFNAFREAVLGLDPVGRMIITFFDDQDINANGITNEKIDYAAERVVEFTEANLPVCTI